LGNGAHGCEQDDEKGKNGFGSLPAVASQI